jgi:dimethylaniline monooxygenase (N-oxide forming)
VSQLARVAKRRVAIIGAGAAGVCSAKYLLEAGLNVEIYEIGTQIGGLWVYGNDNGRSSAYASLHINSEKRNTQFSDFPFPAEIQYFPAIEIWRRI